MRHNEWEQCLQHPRSAIALPYPTRVDVPKTDFYTVKALAGRVPKMKTVVVGGHTRNIGKTSVMVGLIGGLRGLNWTAVKITQYGHGVCSHDGEPCGCVPTEHPFMLTEEQDAHGRGDTCRYLAAGARRSLWLRAREGQLGEAFPFLEEALGGDDYVIIESNSILEFLTPVVYLAVLDSSALDFKDSALRYLRYADALVPVGSGFSAAAWPGLDPRLLADKPVFPVTPGKYTSQPLCRFVENRLGRQNVGGVPVASTSLVGKGRAWQR